MPSAPRCRPSCAIAALAFLPSVASAAGLNFVSGEITVDTVWTAAESPYTVVDDVIVRAGATLTVEPGVIVRFRPDTQLMIGPGLDDDGTLHAVGTAEDAILFTSDFIEPLPGSWPGLHFGTGFNGAQFDADGAFVGGSIMRHAEVWFAGEANAPGIRVERASPWFDMVTVAECAATGVVLKHGDDARFDGCWFLRNGRVDPEVTGGGLHIAGGEDARLTRCTFLDNRAWNGGALLVEAANTSLHQVVLRGNLAERDGGAAWMQGIGHEIMESRFEANIARGVGGGLRAFDASGVKVINCDFVANTARDGGAAHFEGGSKARVRGGRWSGNLAEGGLTFAPPEDTQSILQNGGGAILVASDFASIEDAQFDGNRAIGNFVGGGAVLQAPSASGLLVDSCSFTFNRSGQAGGAIAMGTGSTSMWIRDCTIRHNEVTSGNGGGVWIEGFDAHIIGTRIEFNRTTAAGGGVWTRGLGTDVIDTAIRHNVAGQEGGGIAWLGTAGSLSGEPDAPNCVSENSAPIGSALITGVAGEVKTPLPARYVFWGSGVAEDIEASIHHQPDASDLRRVDFADAVTENPCGSSGNFCPADLDGDNAVNFADLVILIAAFGASDAGDISGDGETDITDLIELLAAWGPCVDD